MNDLPPGWKQLQPGYYVFDPKKCRSLWYTAWVRVTTGQLTMYSERGSVPVSVVQACIDSAPEPLPVYPEFDAQNAWPRSDA